MRLSSRPAPARLTGRRPHSPLPHPAGDSSGTSHSYCCCYSLRCRASLRLRSPPDCSLDCQWGSRCLLSALPQLPHQHQHPLYPRVEPKRTEQVVKPAKKSSVAFVNLFFFKSTTNIKTFFFFLKKDVKKFKKYMSFMGLTHRLPLHTSDCSHTLKKKKAKRIMTFFISIVNKLEHKSRSSMSCLQL